MSEPATSDLIWYRHKDGTRCPFSIAGAKGPWRSTPYMASDYDMLYLIAQRWYLHSFTDDDRQFGTLRIISEDDALDWFVDHSIKIPDELAVIVRRRERPVEEAPTVAPASAQPESVEDTLARYAAMGLSHEIVTASDKQAASGRRLVDLEGANQLELLPTEDNSSRIEHLLFFTRRCEWVLEERQWCRTTVGTPKPAYCSISAIETARLLEESGILIPRWAKEHLPRLQRVVPTDRDGNDEQSVHLLLDSRLDLTWPWDNDPDHPIERALYQTTDGEPIVAESWDDRSCTTYCRIELWRADLLAEKEGHKWPTTMEAIVGGPLRHEDSRPVRSDSARDDELIGLMAPAAGSDPLHQDGAQMGEPREPDQQLIGPAKILFGWKDILTSIGRRYTRNERDRVRRLNDKYHGPISRPTQGGHPRVIEDHLRTWWNALRAQFERQEADANEAAEQREADIKATLQGGHSYGRDGRVLPGIGGHEKSRKSKKATG
jgi:hypothetical protein